MATETPAPGRFRPLVFLAQNTLTQVGAALTTSSALTMIAFWTAEMLRGGPAHPYAGILFLLIMPAIFVLGLILMPLGILLKRRRLRARGEMPTVFPAIDLNRSGDIRRGLTLFGILTIANLAIFGTASYKGVGYLDSTKFCGMTCHHVMTPEYTAYLTSAHSRVECVRCHVGPGASGFVEAKVAGTRQLIEVALGTYSRPVPAPVHTLRPARETCEECHRPEHFVGDRFLVRTRYADDEANTPSTTVLVLKVGGHAGTNATGIHGRHVGAGVEIAYTAYDRRQTIQRVSVKRPSAVEDYVADPSPEVKGEAETRVMDCIDCHNRPTHVFELPDRALDRSMSEGRISPRLPYIKKMALEALKAEYPDRDTGAQRIAATLGEYYQKSYPAVYQSQRPAVDGAVAEVQAIYHRNVFPDMKVTWGTYPNNIGHEDFPGCFRCHDESHKRRDGTAITQDCTACHTILAQDEKNPKVLSDLGLQPSEGQ